MLTKLVSVRSIGDACLDLVFDDGSTACWSAAYLLSRETVLTRPLATPLKPTSIPFSVGQGNVAQTQNLKYQMDRAADLLYAGKLVLRGSIERRTVTYPGETYELPYLIATSVARKATVAERARCQAR